MDESTDLSGSLVDNAVKFIACLGRKKKVMCNGFQTMFRHETLLKSKMVTICKERGTRDNLNTSNRLFLRGRNVVVCCTPQVKGEPLQGLAASFGGRGRLPCTTEEENVELPGQPHRDGVRGRVRKATRSWQDGKGL